MKLSEETGKWSYVGDDGISYEYDEKLAAWFPMVRFFSFLFCLIACHYWET